MRRRRWLYWQGDPGVLVFGLDYRGNLCGKDNDGGLDLESYDYRYWPNTQEMAALGSIQIMDAKSICLKGCPKPAEADESGAVTSVKWVCDYPDDGTPLLPLARTPATRCANSPVASAALWLQNPQSRLASVYGSRSESRRCCDGSVRAPHACGGTERGVGAS